MHFGSEENDDGFQTTFKKSGAILDKTKRIWLDLSMLEYSRDALAAPMLVLSRVLGVVNKYLCA